MFEDDAAVPQILAVRGKRKSRAGQPPTGHSVWIPTDVYDPLAARASHAGVPIAAVLRNLVSPPSYMTPSATQAAVLVRIADRLRDSDIEGARNIVREAMVGLAKTHAAEIQDDAHDWKRGDAR